MYAYIKGTLQDKYDNYIIVEAGGIGYKLYTSLSTLEKIGDIGAEVKVYTHFYVREDVLQLYGFMTYEELGMFELLIGVSGVGPKAALSVLSSMSPSSFGLAVITGDVRSLTNVPGIGKKIAQRIILELQDKIKKEQLTAAQERLPPKADSYEDISGISDAVSALMVLGYSAIEASRAVSEVYAEGMELETLIKNALKELSKV